MLGGRIISIWLILIHLGVKEIVCEVLLVGRKGILLFAIGWGMIVLGCVDLEELYNVDILRFKGKIDMNYWW